MLRFKTTLYLLFSLFLLGASYLLPMVFSPSEANEAISFEKKLHTKESQMKEELQVLMKRYENEKSLNKHEENRVSKELGFSYFIFEGGVLKHWTDDQVQIDSSQLFSNESIVKTSNGWYRKLRIDKVNASYFGLILIQNQYPFQNEFLRNDFHPSFGNSIFKNVQLSKSHIPIHDSQGNILFYLTTKETSYPSIIILSSAILLFFGIVFLLIFLPIYISRKKRLQSLVAIVAALFIRLYLFFQLPSIISSTKLFQSEWFAFNAINPSLGDFFLHLLFVFFILYHLKKLFRLIKNKLLSIFFLVLNLIGGIFSIFLISGSIQSSIINYNLSNFYNLNYLSFIAFLSFILLLCCCFLLLDLGLRILKNSFSIKSSRIILSLFILGLLILSLHNELQHPIYAWMIIPILLINHQLSHSNKQNIIRIAVLLLFSSSVVAYWMNHERENRESAQQKVMVLKLAEERDPIAEYLFNNTQHLIRKDSFLIDNAIHYWQKKEQVDAYIKERYFNSYWDKYQLSFSICSPNDYISTANKNTPTSCINYFQDRIRLDGDIVSSTNLFPLFNFAGRIDYIGEIELSTDSIPYYLYAELSSIYLNENEGYPELLIDEYSQSESLNLEDYSYAVYNENELVYKNGEFNYSTHLKISELATSNFYQYQTENFQHLAYQKDNSITIILSKPSSSLFDFLTSLAYLSVILTVIFILFSIKLVFFPFHFKLNFYDFSTKIQLFLVGSLLSSLIVLAWGTTYYIEKQYQQKNSTNLEEKIRSVNIELESKIGTEEFLSNELESFVASYLVKFSNVFYSDINLYTTEGLLYSTSRPEVFSKGIKSRRMHPRAFQALHKDNKAQWVQQESIGKMDYLSAYIPFRNYENEIVGYLNLPYFAKHGELEKEISSFLVSTLNIYVGIFVLTLLISVLLINQLAKPLLLIRQQISKLKLGSAIELIDWKSNDEIGALVQEYNRIAVELSESAALLAKSEREVAWREMAKQVAHEIKNPLTPMKLSIQHLQRAAANNSDDLTERIDRITITLVEQIETLSSIATAFSSFAKLPTKNYERIDILPVLQNAMNLYLHDHNIELINPAQLENMFVNGDKDQQLRVFNNLIKNAIQATEAVEQAHIKARINQNDSSFIIEINDNGMGISETQAERIFEPNFTTKSAGTGLGLAMSKSIIEQMGGSISFTSNQQEGTTFTLVLPKADELS